MITSVFSYIRPGVERGLARTKSCIPQEILRKKTVPLTSDNYTLNVYERFAFLFETMITLQMETMQNMWRNALATALEKLEYFSSTLETTLKTTT